jgi:hypothetical protein
MRWQTRKWQPCDLHAGGLLWAQDQLALGFHRSHRSDAPLIARVFEQSDDLMRICILSLPSSIECIHKHPTADCGISAGLDQKLRHFIAALVSVVAQWRISNDTVIVRIDVRTGSDEASDDIEMVLLNRVMQGRLAESVKTVERISLLDQILDSGEVTLLSRTVQLLSLKLCCEVAAHG